MRKKKKKEKKSVELSFLLDFESEITMIDCKIYRHKLFFVVGVGV